jgi:hypothetical protein
VSASAWWVVDDGHVLAGPFPSKVDAQTAQPPAGQTWEHIEALAHVFGVRRTDGAVEPRPSPADKAFEAHLGEQLDRLSDGYGSPLAQHSMAVLTREVAIALVEAGFELHHCAAYTPTGGVCLTPTSGHGDQDGVIVSWTQHDRMAKDHVRGYDRYSAVQETMNYAVAEVLVDLGFAVEEFRQATSHIVTATPSTATPSPDAGVTG